MTTDFFRHKCIEVNLCGYAIGQHTLCSYECFIFSPVILVAEQTTYVARICSTIASPKFFVCPTAFFAEQRTVACYQAPCLSHACGLYGNERIY